MTRRGRLWLACAPVAGACAVAVAATVLPGTTASAATAAAPLSCGKTFDTSTIRSSFPLRLRITLPTRRWCMLYGDVPGEIDPVHVGTPKLDETQWWGPAITLVDGARVVTRADALRPAVAPTIATSRPWPADFLGYVASLPQVKVVAGPSAVTIGGIRGTRITVKTPRMHPLLWLKGDSAWLGGGQTGLDPAGRRELILLTVHGKKLLLTEADPAASFAARLSQVHVLWKSIKFRR
jgi:hypothetical protein